LGLPAGCCRWIWRRRSRTAPAIENTYQGLLAAGHRRSSSRHQPLNFPATFPFLMWTARGRSLYVGTKRIYLHKFPLPFPSPRCPLRHRRRQLPLTARVSDGFARSRKNGGLGDHVGSFRTRKGAKAMSREAERKQRWSG
jgi:hypothetical protein